MSEREELISDIVGALNDLSTDELRKVAKIIAEHVAVCATTLPVQKLAIAPVFSKRGVRVERKLAVLRNDGTVVSEADTVAEADERQILSDAMSAPRRSNVAWAAGIVASWLTLDAPAIEEWAIGLASFNEFKTSDVPNLAHLFQHGMQYRMKGKPYSEWTNCRAMVVLWIHDAWAHPSGDKRSVRDDVHVYEVGLSAAVMDLLTPALCRKYCTSLSSGRNTEMKSGFVYLALRYKKV